MVRYTQEEWQQLVDGGRAIADDEASGTDPQAWIVEGEHGFALNPNDESDDVIFEAD